MRTVFAQLAPELAPVLQEALRSEGFATQAAMLPEREVERWIYDRSVNAGYVYLRQSEPVRPGEVPAAKTLVFMGEHGFNVDLREHGEIWGIELLEHAPLFFRLGASAGDANTV